MGWTCEACTFINENKNASTCGMCQTRRGGAAGLATNDTQSNRPKGGGGGGEKSKQVTLFGNFVDPKHEKKKPTNRKASSQDAAHATVVVGGGGNPKKMTVPEYAQFSLPYSTLSKQAHEHLRNIFGFQELRGLQPQAVECALRRQSQIVVMATGGGKSLCFQLPALTLGGTTIVISPLKALIADQVQALIVKGIAAAFLSSQLTEAAKTDVMERVLQRSLRSRGKPSDSASWKGKYVTLLYCTPEMLQTERFRVSLLELHKSGRLTGFAVDEAHCVSSWGHDFRPAYLKLDYLRETFPALPLMACTATATPQVLADIRKLLRLEDRPCHLGSFDRKNVFYKVRYRDLLEESPRGASGDMVDFIKRQHEKAQHKGAKCNGIVYVHRQKDTVELAQIISKETGLRAESYHGGMKDADRTRIQEAWTSGEAPIAIATVAFGMGIDCPHVRYVIHWNVAKTVEGFYQESGRAGRDGLPAYSLLYFSKRDVSTFEYLARMKKSKQKDANLHALGALEKMVEYCTKPACRRQYLLRFFGDPNTDPKTVCQRSCDFCRNPDKVTKTIEAASCANDFKFHTAAEKEWDGQWSAPHGDEEFDEDDVFDKTQISKSYGLSLMGEDVEDSSFQKSSSSLKSGKAGFTKASDILAKFEAREKRDMENGSGSRKRKEATPIIPEHLRKLAPNPLSNLEQKVASMSSTSLEANAAKLRADLEKLKAAREALTKNSASSVGRKGPPPPPPSVVFKKRRR